MKKSSAKKQFEVVLRHTPVCGYSMTILRFSVVLDSVICDLLLIMVRTAIRDEHDRVLGYKVPTFPLCSCPPVMKPKAANSNQQSGTDVDMPQIKQISPTQNLPKT